MVNLQGLQNVSVLAQIFELLTHKLKKIGNKLWQHKLKSYLNLKKSFYQFVICVVSFINDLLLLIFWQ